MIPNTEGLMLPTYEEVIDMKNHFPELNQFIEKKRKKYIQIIKEIDESELSDNEKCIKKQTYYVYFMIFKKILNSTDYTCSLDVSDINNTKIAINNDVYIGSYDLHLLQDLLGKNHLYFEELDKDTSNTCVFMTVSLKERERSSR